MYLFTDELLCIRMAICVVLIVVVVLWCFSSSFFVCRHFFTAKKF